METKQTKLGKFDLSEAAIAGRILDRHASAIEVKKRPVAIKNLAKVLKAALSLSLKRGFHAMSMRDLAREAEMSMGGLYVYVDHKDTLLTMILSEVIETGLAVLEDLPDDVRGNPREELRWFIETHILMTEEMTRWFAFVYFEAKAFPPKDMKAARGVEESTTRMLNDILSRGMKAGIFADGDPDLHASMIKPLLQDWYVKRYKYKRRKITADDYIAQLIRFIEHGLVSGARMSEVA